MPRVTETKSDLQSGRSMESCTERKKGLSVGTLVHPTISGVTTRDTDNVLGHSDTDTFNLDHSPPPPPVSFLPGNPSSRCSRDSTTVRGDRTSVPLGLGNGPSLGGTEGEDPVQNCRGEIMKQIRQSFKVL